MWNCQWEQSACELFQQLLQDPAVDAVATAGDTGADWHSWQPCSIERQADGTLLITLLHDYSSYLHCWAELDLLTPRLLLQRRDDKTGAGDAELLVMVPDTWWQRLQVLREFPNAPCD